MKKVIIALLLCISIVTQLSFVAFLKEKQIPDNRPTNYLFDNTKLLDDRQIEEKLIDLNDKHYHTNLKPQLAIAVVNKLDDDLEETANTVARKWKIGYSDTNVGILLLVDIENRQMRTETSDEMAILITDSETQQLNDTLKDDFREKRYTDGILKYISTYEKMIDKHLSLTKDDLQKKQEEQLTEDINIVFVCTLIFVVCVISAKRSSGLSTAEFMLFTLSGLSSGSSSGSGSSRTHSSSGGGFSGGGSSSGW